MMDSSECIGNVSDNSLQSVQENNDFSAKIKQIMTKRSRLSENKITEIGNKNVVKEVIEDDENLMT